MLKAQLRSAGSAFSHNKTVALARAGKESAAKRTATAANTNLISLNAMAQQGGRFGVSAKQLLLPRCFRVIPPFSDADHKLWLAAAVPASGDDE